MFGRTEEWSLLTSLGVVFDESAIARRDRPEHVGRVVQPRASAQPESNDPSKLHQSRPEDTERTPKSKRSTKPVLGQVETTVVDWSELEPAVLALAALLANDVEELRGLATGESIQESGNDVASAG